MAGTSSGRTIAIAGRVSLPRERTGGFADTLVAGPDRRPLVGQARAVNDAPVDRAHSSEAFAFNPGVVIHDRENTMIAFVQ